MVIETQYKNHDDPSVILSVCGQDIKTEDATIIDQRRIASLMDAAAYSPTAKQSLNVLAESLLSLKAARVLADSVIALSNVDAPDGPVAGPEQT